MIHRSSRHVYGYLGIVEVACHALQNDGAISQGCPNLTEAQVELGLNGTQCLQAELVGIVHGQQWSHQLVQLLLGLLFLNHHPLLQPAYRFTAISGANCGSVSSRLAAAAAAAEVLRCFVTSSIDVKSEICITSYTVQQQKQQQQQQKQHQQQQQ